MSENWKIIGEKGSWAIFLFIQALVNKRRHYIWLRHCHSIDKKSPWFYKVMFLLFLFKFGDISIASETVPDWTRWCFYRLWNSSWLNKAMIVLPLKQFLIKHGDVCIASETELHYTRWCFYCLWYRTLAWTMQELFCVCAQPMRGDVTM